MDDKQLTTTELIARVTNEDKHRFLENYPKCNMRTNKTAEAIGKNESTIYYWMHEDNDFLQAFQALKKELETLMLNKYLENIREIAFDQLVPPQTRLLASFFEVKKLDPAYRDRQEGTKVFTGDIVIECNIPDSETPPDIPFIEGEYKELT